MATRVLPAPTDADNSSGNLPAVHSDWRFGDADSMSARDVFDPTTDAGYTTAGVCPTANLSISLLPLRGSPYMTSYVAFPTFHLSAVGSKDALLYKRHRHAARAISSRRHSESGGALFRARLGCPLAGNSELRPAHGFLFQRSYDLLKKAPACGGKGFATDF